MQLKKYGAEAFGTFALVFAGTGAIVVNELRGGVLSHVGVALTFGLVVAAMIYALGEASGAHFNPAVTLGFWFARRLPARQVAPYVLSQCAGAVAASVLLGLLFGTGSSLGATMPSGSHGQSFVMEVVLTCLLMFVILSVSSGAREKGVMAGAAIGATVALAALCGGPVSGASLNPARSLAPALVGGQLAALWIYLLAPPLGAWLGVWVCRGVREPGCCTRAALSSPCEA